MSEFSHLKGKLLAEQVEDQIYHYILDTPIIDTAVMMFVNVTHKKLTEETIETHRMIVDAIERHDPIGARSAMVMHLNYNRTYIKMLNDGELPVS